MMKIKQCHSKNISRENTFELYSVKKRLDAFAKSIDPRQPFQTVQADMGQNFSPSLNFLHINGPFYITILSAVRN